MPTPEYKVCADCGNRKHRNEYYRVVGYPDTCRTRCKECYKSRGREAWKIKYPPRHERPLEDYPQVDTDFGHWLAGFIDGEGSFAISRPRNSFVCNFHLALRRDDVAILNECCTRTELGYVIPDVKRVKRSPNENPQSRWEVGGKRQCMRFVQIVEAFPLRAKKANDFVVWRKAVIEWNNIGTGKGGSPVDWSRMEKLYHQIKDVRKYVEPDDYPTPNFTTRSRSIPEG